VYQLATGLGGLESEESKQHNTETNRGRTTLHSLLLPFVARAVHTWHLADIDANAEYVCIPV
jgi:hypothetical protein